MKIIRMDQVPQKAANSPLFTGGMVTLQTLVEADTERPLSMTLVNFAAGARNKFHRHSSYQILIVTAGKGIFVTEKDQKPISAGDIVISPPGEKHWHGATQDSHLSHISIIAAGSRMEQLEE